MERLASPDFESTSRASLGMEKFVGEYFYLDIEKLIPFRNQARQVFDQEEIEQLAQTIKDHGIRQPLTVLKSDLKEGCFEVVSGERRLRAAKIAGLDKVPCIIMQDPLLAEEVALIENIQRADLHPIELGNALKRLLSNARWGGQGDLAEKLGMKQSALSEALKFADLPDEISKKLLSHNIRSRDVLRKMAKAESLEEMRTVLNREPIIKAAIDANGADQKTKSILRINMTGSEFSVQKSKLNELNDDRRSDLRKLLLQLIKQLSN